MINDVATYEALGYRRASANAIFGRGSELMSGEPIYDGGFREATVEDIFGWGTTLGSGGEATLLEPTLWSGVMYHAIALFTVVLYLYMLLRSWHFVVAIFGTMFSISTERAMAMQGGELPLQRFKSAATLLGVLLVTLAGIRLADDAMALGGELYDDTVQWLPFYSLVVVGLISLWLILFGRVVFWITRSDDVMQISSLARMAFIRAAVVLYPPIICWLVSAGQTAEVWFTVSVVGLMIVAIAYLKDTFLLFVAKKVSIFYWILYLCTAILLPLSFVITVLAKYFG